MRRLCAARCVVVGAVLVSSTSRAAALTCLQRALTLLSPCNTALTALSDTVKDGRVNMTAALLALGGSPTSLPATVSQCCTAVRPFNDAQCLCDDNVLAALSTLSGGAAASGMSSEGLSQAALACGFALKVVQPDGACGVTPMSPPPSPAASSFSAPSTPSPSLQPASSVAAPDIVRAAQPIVPSSPPPPAPAVARPPPLAVLGGLSGPAPLVASAAAAPGPQRGGIASATCPTPSPVMWSLVLCASLCASDLDCRASEACCSNGCGRVCVVTMH